MDFYQEVTKITINCTPTIQYQSEVKTDCSRFVYCNRYVRWCLRVRFWEMLTRPHACPRVCQFFFSRNFKEQVNLHNDECGLYAGFEHAKQKSDYH
jgi:hypothetical protein